MIIRMFFVFFMLLFVQSCAVNDNSETQLRQIVSNYFDVYAARENIEQLMSFYDEQAQLEDMVYGNHVVGKSSIASFFDWNNGKFVLEKNMPTLIVQKQVVEGNTVVTEGYFNKFMYDGQTLGPWRFVIWLEFNQNNKIIRHVDWINYTPKKHYTDGENLNTLIHKKR